MTLLVLEPGFLTTVQDMGRTGYQRLGVPVSGAMDRFALLAANALLGNPSGCAVLEAVLEGPTLRAQADCLAAAAGMGIGLEVDGQLLPFWMAVRIRRGSTLRLVCCSEGGWAYLAVCGGMDVPLVLSSRSTCLRGGFGGIGGRVLRAGDEIPLGAFPAASFNLAGNCLPPERRLAYSPSPRLAVLPGPQQDAFTEEGIAAFLSSSYRIQPDSDRMGFRLQGEPVSHRGEADILSQGLAAGAVQVPADGQPIVAMSDHQTTGGYTQIAVVASADLPLLAQCPFASGEVCFYPTTLTEARQRLHSMVQGIAQGIVKLGMDQEDFYAA
jgi:antagonist of KipI